MIVWVMMEPYDGAMHEAGLRKSWKKRAESSQVAQWPSGQVAVASGQVAEWSSGQVTVKPPLPPGEGGEPLGASRVRAQATDTADDHHNLATALGISPLLATLLNQRGLHDPETARRFLEPKLTDLHDPALLPGLDVAAQRLTKAVRDGQPIVIYGDYDVDGVCASAILWHMLKLAGATVTTYVPHRIDEGYGLNTKALCKLAGVNAPTLTSDPGEGDEVANDDAVDTDNTITVTQPPLIISVDCGITAIEPAKFMADHGIDLIITDHHEFNPQQLPAAQVLVHPRLPQAQGEPYPFPDLCGAGVAFKLAWQFARVWNGSDRVPSNYKTLLLDLLSLAALGTVADVVTLLGENRIITAFGLGQIKRTQFVGLNALIDASKLRDEKIDAYHVGFVLGPRLNACGRMGHAREAVHLLTTAGGDEATKIAKFLCQQNDVRRATEKSIFNEAKSLVEEHGYHGPQQRAIVLGKEGWHAGVVGIVASRLVEAFHRPVVMLSVADGHAHGSARSVPGVSMHEALCHCAPHLTTFGGHAMAAGLKLEATHIEVFRQSLVTFINAKLPVEALTGWLTIDVDCTLDDLSFKLAEQVQKMAPFGAGNPSPLFCLRNVILAGPVRRMGQSGKHLRLLLRSLVGGGGRHAEAVWFGAGDLEDQLVPGSRLDIVFRPVISTWQGQRRLELHVEDARVNG